MSEATTVTVMTNSNPKSCVTVKCDCATMWSLAQQFSVVRLSTVTGDMKATLIKNYAVRARRIAATYARFYLEQEDGGKPDKKGRFYWMALGAFASKTVACTFEFWQVKGLGLVSSATREGLGKGNFWLFCDISGWHWYYSNYPRAFDTCLASRNSDQYVDAVKKQVKQLPWNDKALPKLNGLAVSPHIKAGFSKVKEIENTSNLTKRRQLQLAHLLDIANHEQGVILQPLIYDDPEFAKWIKVQRNPWVEWASPNLELVFSSACSTDKADLKSTAAEDTKLEDLASRMKWITKAADKFHQLMRERTAYMEGELKQMAGWVAMGDK